MTRLVVRKDKVELVKEELRNGLTISEIAQKYGFPIAEIREVKED